MAGTLVRGVAVHQGGKAWRVLECQIAGPEAKRVNDLQIGGLLRVDTLQVKWSQYGGNFTCNIKNGESVASITASATPAPLWEAKAPKQLRKKRASTSMSV